jgi:hypothetical protein
MRADIHDGPEHMLQSETEYIDARPHQPASTKSLLHRTAGPYIGSKSEVGSLERHVRSTLNSRRRRTASICPFRARKRLMHGSKQHRHSITLSARSMRSAGTSCPIALAVLRLITNSNRVGCSTGMSIGFAPRSTLTIIRASWRKISVIRGP